MPFKGAMTVLAEAGELPKAVEFTRPALARRSEGWSGEQSLDK
jgi:hypothetical protein